MTQAEPSIIYLKYKSLEDVLKVIVYSAQSAIGLTPMLYHIAYNNRQIIFILTGTIGGSTIHYIILDEKPTKKLTVLEKKTTKQKKTKTTTNKKKKKTKKQRP